jgi:hypothetical protein
MDELIPLRDEHHYLETIIERGRQTFIEVGTALMTIREKRTYRADGWGTFEEYCAERWGWTRGRAYQLMDAATVAIDVSTNVDIPAPRNEGQARELVRVADPEERRSVWHEAHEAHGENVTAAKVREIVDRRTPPLTVADVIDALPPPPEEPADERAFRLLEVQAIAAMRFAPAQMAAVQRGDRAADVRFFQRFDTWLHDLMDALEEPGAQLRRVK